MKMTRSLKRLAHRFLREYKEGVVDLLFNADTRYTEVISSLLLIGWGLVLAFPARGDAGVSDIQRSMQQLAPIWLWSTFIIALGIVEGFGATLSRFYPLRVATGAIAGPAWMAFACLIAVSGYRVIGFLVYALLAALVSWAYIRLGAGTLREPGMRAARAFVRFVRGVWG